MPIGVASESLANSSNDLRPWSAASDLVSVVIHVGWCCMSKGKTEHAEVHGLSLHHTIAGPTQNISGLGFEFGCPHLKNETNPEIRRGAKIRTWHNQRLQAVGLNV